MARTFAVYWWVRFFQSLQKDSASSSSTAKRKQDAVCQEPGERVAFLRGVLTSRPRAEPRTLDFSLETIIRFKNDHMMHTAATKVAPQLPRRRPNYNNKKRRFLAKRPQERRR